MAPARSQNPPEPISCDIDGDQRSPSFLPLSIRTTRLTLPLTLVQRDNLDENLVSRGGDDRGKEWCT
jgi:hypothetical protein